MNDHKVIRSVEEPGLFDQPLIQTKLRGTHEQEYAIYVDCAKSLGWSVKTFDEWMAS